MFKTKEIKTDTLGSKLKSARESKKMALSQISRKIKIHVNTLKSLEQGSYSELPADVYIIAYLKKYADFLDLNINEILEQFKTEKGIIEDLSMPLADRKNPSYFFKKSFLVITPKRVGLVFSILVITLIFGYLWHQLSYLIYPPIIEIIQPASDLTTKDKLIEISGHTKSGAYLTINGKEVQADKNGYFRDLVNLELGLNILKIETKDRFGKTNTIIRRVMVIK